MKSRGHSQPKRVEQAFARAGAALPGLRRGASLLLGCSAGGDSMALLDLTAREAARRGWIFSVAHFDHAQRPESAEEARFVRARCAELRVPFIGGRMRAARPRGGKPAKPPNEERMREARHAFFKKAIAKSGADALLLAHQADDRAETFIMRLLAGSGPSGLASIRAVSEVGGMTILRPLLGIRREELRAYLRARGLAWRDDPSNQATARKRAWVRAEVLPLFDARMGTEVAPRIARAAELAEEEEAALGEACEILLDEIAGGAEERPPSGRAPVPASRALGALALDGPAWKNAGRPLRMRLMRLWLRRLRAGAAAHPPKHAAVAQAADFAERGAPGAELRTVGRLRLKKEAGALLALPPERAGRARRTASIGAGPRAPETGILPRAARPRTSSARRR